MFEIQVCERVSALKPGESKTFTVKGYPPATVDAVMCGYQFDGVLYSTAAEVTMAVHQFLLDSKK